jgi:DNA-binding GntR family transcriptional regulator
VNVASREEGPARKSEAAYEQLKHLVVNGQVRPGRHLVAHEVAEKLGISATPLREAMVRLASEGLLDRDNSHGFSTKEFRVEEQRQILIMCCISLSYALRAVGAQLSEQLLTVLADLKSAPTETLEEAAQVAARIRDLYLEAARAAGNDVLQQHCRVMMDRSHLIRMIDLKMGDAGQETVEALRAIGEALSNGDPEAAVTIAQQVLARRIERLPILVREANYIASESNFP